MARQKYIRSLKYNLAGQRFGRLIAQTPLQQPYHKIRWECVCDCGTRVSVTSENLRSGHIQSCGCLRRERLLAARRTHGGSHTALYSIYSGMLNRCYNANEPTYARYGGRGILVCQRWRDAFDAFRQDMGEPPSPLHSLDRYPDRDGPYSPDNCRWATAKEQANNRASNRWITYGDVTLTLMQWAERVGIAHTTIRYRLRHGWTIEKTLTTPSRQHRYSHKRGGTT